MSGPAAAASHTGSLATDDRVFDGACRQAGVVRAATIEEAYEAAATFATQPLPQGPNVCVVSTAGGWGVVTADAISRTPGLRLLPLPDDLKEELDRHLPPRWSRNNPIDMAGGETKDTIPTVLEIAARHPAVDAVVVLGLGIQGNEGRMELEGPFYPGHGLERIVGYHERQDRRFTETAAALSKEIGKPILMATELAIDRSRQPGGRRLPRQRPALLRVGQPCSDCARPSLDVRRATGNDDQIDLRLTRWRVLVIALAVVLVVSTAIAVQAERAPDAVAATGVRTAADTGVVRAPGTGADRRSCRGPPARRAPERPPEPHTWLVVPHRRGRRPRRLQFERDDPVDSRVGPEAHDRGHGAVDAGSGLEVDHLGEGERDRPHNGVVDGDLWLVGGGDPLLMTDAYAQHFRNQPVTHTSLEQLADQIVAAGVHEVRGSIVGDDSRYDRMRAQCRNGPARTSRRTTSDRSAP